jgi:hypothetical protein
MRVVSVNVGMPREVEWNGRKVLTGIFKSPVAAKLTVRRLNIDGDGQADLAPRRAGQGRLRLSERALRALEGAARSRVDAGDLRREPDNGGSARGCGPNRRRVPRRDGPADHHAAEVAVLQACLLPRTTAVILTNPHAEGATALRNRRTPRFRWPSPRPEPGQVPCHPEASHPPSSSTCPHKTTARVGLSSGCRASARRRPYWGMIS